VHLKSAVSIVAIMMAGCGAPADEVAVRSAAQAPSAIPSAAMTRVETSPTARSDDEAMRRQRMLELQGQVNALRIERDRLAGQVDAHQIEGEKRLSELKLQWKSAAGSEREQFAEAARNEMESALMLDEEYRAQLQDAEEKMQRIEHELRDLRERETAPQKQL
jgi:hypothetical protein